MRRFFDRNEKPCDAEPADAAPVAEAWEFCGVRFGAPADWSVETIPDMNGVLLMSPDQECDFPANLWLELNRDPERRPLEQALDEYAASLAGAKSDFVLRSKSCLEHPSGRTMGLVKYTSVQDGIPVTQWEVMLPLSGNGVLFVQASVQSDLFPRYEGLFHAMIRAIELPASFL
jgi:hypothetical protein